VLSAGRDFENIARIVPVRTYEGRRIERREVKFITPGVTTQLEVERRLGPSTRDCDRPPAIT